MFVRKFGQNKEKIFRIASMVLNFFLTVAMVAFVVHLVAPLFGGELLVNALILYGSWIFMALFLKFLIKRSQKGFPIRVYQYFLLCLYNIVCMFLWFPYPISILFSILSIVGIALAYKANQREGNQGGRP